MHGFYYVTLLRVADAPRRFMETANEITFSTTRREERDLIGPSMVVRTTLHETIGWSTSRRGDAFTIRLTTVDRVHVGWQTGRLIRGGDFRKKIKK